MKKHLVIAALVCSMLVLSACGSKKDKQNEAMIDGIANEDCSNYVSYLTCIADQLGESGQATKQALEQTVSSREQYSTSELNTICEGAIAGLNDVKEMYADFDCALGESPEEDSTSTGDTA